MGGNRERGERRPANEEEGEPTRGSHHRVVCAAVTCVLNYYYILGLVLLLGLQGHGRWCGIYQPLTGPRVVLAGSGRVASGRARRCMNEQQKQLQRERAQ